jgi:hypothetical protein
MSLELHAKTYYDNPDVEGGDEHSIGVPDMNGKVNANAPVTYRGLSWTLLRGEVFNQVTPLGGYLNVHVILGNCQHPGMHDAELTLACSVSYWGSPPNSGWKTVDWSATLLHTEFSITNITN